MKRTIWMGYAIILIILNSNLIIGVYRIMYFLLLTLCVNYTLNTHPIMKGAFKPSGQFIWLACILKSDFQDEFAVISQNPIHTTTTGYWTRNNNIIRGERSTNKHPFVPIFIHFNLSCWLSKYCCWFPWVICRIFIGYVLYNYNWSRAVPRRLGLVGKLWNNELLFTSKFAG